MDDSLLEAGRAFLKDSVRRTVDFSQTDQQRGLPPPPLEKPFAADARRVALTPPGKWKNVGPLDLQTAVRGRRSRRKYKPDPLLPDELSFLLWATQGIEERLDRGTALRTVPSAGARHALETYLCVFRVEGLAPGFYRYLPLEHQLLLEFTEERAEQKLTAAALGQRFVAQAAVTFIWTTIPYRMEWRYGAASHKVIAMEAGHVCQNLYLACEAIGAGACAVAAYHQELLDRLLQIDGVDEFAVYLAPVGKV